MAPEPDFDKEVDARILDKALSVWAQIEDWPEIMHDSNRGSRAYDVVEALVAHKMDPAHHSRGEVTAASNIFLTHDHSSGLAEALLTRIYKETDRYLSRSATAPAVCH